MALCADYFLIGMLIDCLVCILTMDISFPSHGPPCNQVMKNTGETDAVQLPLISAREVPQAL